MAFDPLLTPLILWEENIAGSRVCLRIWYLFKVRYFLNWWKKVWNMQCKTICKISYWTLEMTTPPLFFSEVGAYPCPKTSLFSSHKQSWLDISLSHAMKENIVLEFVWECLEIAATRLTFNRLSELIVHLVKRNQPPENIFTRPNCFPIGISLSSHALKLGWGFNYYMGGVRS